MLRTPIPNSGELDPFGEGAHLVVERDKPRRFYLVEEPPEDDDSEDEDEDDDDDEDEDEADEEEDAEDEAEDDEAGGEEGGEKEDDEDDETDPKEARARRFGRGMKAREVGPGSIHTAKWDRCTKKVRARGGPYNEYAVCTASVGYEGSIKAGHRRKGRKAKEVNMDALDHELQTIFRESARGTFEEAAAFPVLLRRSQNQPLVKGRKKKRQPLVTATKKRRQPLVRGYAR